MLFNRNGSFSFLAGIVVLFVLLAGYLTWILYGDSLYREGPRSDPPSSLLLQDLFNVENISSESVESNSTSMDGFMGLSEQPMDGLNQSGNELNYYLNEPRQRVVVGNKYIYEPRFSDDTNPSLTVEEAPDGFVVEQETRFAW